PPALPPSPTRRSSDLLTHDDTFAHLGETPPAGGSPHDPARMVGNGATTGANAAVHDLGRDDVIVLCSDGVHKHLERRDWCGVLRSEEHTSELQSLRHL